MSRRTVLLAGSVSLTAALLALPCFALAPAPDQKAGEPEVRVFCPVAGPGKVIQPDQCTSGYCPRKANPKLALDYKGGKILFCCGDCLETFKKEPAKFAASANLQLAATGQAQQVKCPKCGKQPDKAIHHTVAGVSVRFCTAECKEQFQRVYPIAQFRSVFEDAGFAKVFAMTGKSAPAPKTSATTAGGCCDARPATACNCACHTSECPQLPRP
jgi:YHS domain-containing protein